MRHFTVLLFAPAYEAYFPVSGRERGQQGRDHQDVLEKFTFSTSFFLFCYHTWGTLSGSGSDADDIHLDEKGISTDYASIRESEVYTSDDR